jgi:aspartate kinase
MSTETAIPDNDPAIRSISTTLTPQTATPTSTPPTSSHVLEPHVVAAPPAAHAPAGVLVQKFGGSSLADAAGIKRAAERISRAVDAGHQVVAVVSAMGDTTDELCDLAADLSPRPHPSNLDALLSIGELVSSALLAIALTELGRSPHTFTGSQAGLITDSVHGKARITDVRPGQVRASLARGEVPIVAGFQGRTKKGKVVTTLGRGGSDLTAVALAAALGARTCEIYTDVDGVYTADPRVVPTARKIATLTSEEMLELAASGSKVLHARCVGYASRFGVPIRVRSSFSEDPGTLIEPERGRQPFQKPVREKPVVTRIGSSNSAVMMTVVGIPDDANGAGAGGLFDVICRSGVTVEVVRRTPRPDSSRSDVVLVLPAAEADAALAVLRTAQPAMGFEDLRHGGPVGRVSIAGIGMRSSPEVLCTFLNALSGIGVECDLVEISETGIRGITRSDRLADAERAVRRAFGASSADEITPTGRFPEPILEPMPVPSPVPSPEPGLTNPAPLTGAATRTRTATSDWGEPAVRELVSAGSAPIGASRAAAHP